MTKPRTSIPINKDEARLASQALIQQYARELSDRPVERMEGRPLPLRPYEHDLRLSTIHKLTRPMRANSKQWSAYD